MICTQLDKHIKVCQKLKICCGLCKQYVDKQHACEYTPVECLYCRLDFPLIRIRQHHEICLSRRLTCDKCDSKYTLEDGHSDCPYAVVACEYCNITVENRNLREHLNSCTSKIVECRYKWCGCGYKSTVDNVNKHYNEYTSKHLELSDMYNEKQNKLVNELINQIESKK
jgi:hypothetical protein